MPETDVDKPGKNPTPEGDGTEANGAGANGAPLSLEEELDQLLADIEVAVEELDPLGDLEEQAAAAKELANAGDPTYDEIEDKYEVIAPGATDEKSDDAGGASDDDPIGASTTDAEAALDAELDDLIESIGPEPAEPAAPKEGTAQRKGAQAVDDGGAFKPDPQKQLNEEQAQIDHELDALLAEAGALVEEPDTERDEPAAEMAETADAASQAESEQTSEAPSTTPDTEQIDPAETPSRLDSSPEDATVEEPPAAMPTEPGVSSESVGAEPETPSDGSPVDASEVIEDRVEQASPPEPQPADEAPGRSIEDVDADLASKADTVIEELTEPEEGNSVSGDEAAEPGAEGSTGDDDAFRSSDEVVDEVIEQHASTVESEGGVSDEEADALAQLMAESPASAEMSVAPSEAKPEADRTDDQAASSQAASAPTPATPVAGPVGTRDSAPAEAKPSRFAPLLRVVELGKPVALRVARVLSKPLELVPPRVRDDIGWLSLVTMFLALAVMVALALFR